MAWIEATKRRLHRNVLALSGKAAHDLAFALKTKTYSRCSIRSPRRLAAHQQALHVAGYPVGCIGVFDRHSR
jgi:hypothetical protein